MPAKKGKKGMAAKGRGRPPKAIEDDTVETETPKATKTIEKKPAPTSVKKGRGRLPAKKAKKGGVKRSKKAKKNDTSDESTPEDSDIAEEHDDVPATAEPVTVDDKEESD